MKKLICVSILVFAILGCSVNPSELPDKYVKETAKKLKFTSIKAGKNEVCFGFVASRKTGSGSSTGLGAVWVPCDLVRDVLVD